MLDYMEIDSENVLYSIASKLTKFYIFNYLDFMLGLRREP